MFASACAIVRESLYGILASSRIPPNQMKAGLGTGFMVSPGLLATAAHLVHQDGNPTAPLYTSFQVIRAPNIGQAMETAQLIAEEATRDLALLRITNPAASKAIALETNNVPIGTACGSLGFPLSTLTVTQGRSQFNLVQRFQGANVSGTVTEILTSGQSLGFLETDAFMYEGSSGCPLFLTNGKVIGMHVRSFVRPTPGTTAPATRIAISRFIPATDIVRFAASNGITI